MVKWGEIKSAYARDTVTTNTGSKTFSEVTGGYAKLLHFSASLNYPAYIALYYQIAIAGTVRTVPLKETVGRVVSWDGEIIIPAPQGLYVYWEASVIDKTNAGLTVSATYQMGS